MKSILFASAILLLLLLACPFSRCSGTTVYIVGMVYEEKDFDGEYDEGEPGVPGVRVELQDEKGNTLDTQYTDSSGRYSFTVSLFAWKNYNLKIYAPEEYTLQGGATAEEIKVEIVNENEYTVRPIPLKPIAPTSGAGGSPPAQKTITLTPSADSTVTSPFPGENYGDLNNLWIDDDSVTYLRFLLDGLPAGSLVESVTLTLFQDGTGSASGQTALVTYPDPTQTWDEAGVAWNNRPAYAPGALSAPMQMADYNGLGSTDSVNLTDAFRYCQQAYPNQQYFDAMIYYPETGHSSQGWYSRQSQDPPQLNITYTLP